MVDSISSVVAATTTTSTTDTTTTDSSSIISSDFETFLEMLTVQLQNQDPLDPMDSADYSMQLATFSSVEQQVLSNDYLAEISGKFSTMGLADVAGWVGMETLSDEPTYFDGSSPIDFQASPETRADTMQISITNASGEVVQVVETNASSDVLQWSGLDTDGNAYPAGEYTFEIASYADDEFISSSTAESYSRIVEVRSDSGNNMLVLQSGSEISAERISSLREAA